MSSTIAISQPAWPLDWLSTGTATSGAWRRAAVAAQDEHGSRTDIRRVDWLEDVHEALGRLEKLPAGWAGSGSKPISKHAIYAAERLMRDALAESQAQVLPAFVPSADGSVQIEWHRITLQIETTIEPDGNVSTWVHDRVTGGELEESGDEAVSLLLRWAPRAAAPNVNDNVQIDPKADAVFPVYA